MSDSTTFSFEIVTPEKVLITGDYESVELPGNNGEFQILPGHTPFLTGLTIGAVTLKKGSQKKFISISGGYCEVFPDKATVLAHTAELSDKIDKNRAQEAEKRARKRITDASNNDSIDLDRAELALARALNRLSITKLK